MFKEAMQSTTEACKMPFTWFPEEPAWNKCILLKKLKVHNDALWRRECFCNATVPFGNSLPLLGTLFQTDGPVVRVSLEQVNERLQRYWKVEEGRDLLMRPVKETEAPPTDWKSYCELRSIPLSSPLPLILDTPLTIYHALRQLPDLDTSPGSTICIHLVGVEKELDQWPLLLELHNLLPGVELKFEFVGDHVPTWANSRALEVATGEGGSSPSVQFRFWKGSYGKHTHIIESLHPATLVFAQNAGLAAPEYLVNWKAAVANMQLSMVGTDAPQACYFTDYMKFSAECNKKFIEAVMAGLGNTNMQRGALRSNLIVSEVELNPFRKPFPFRAPVHNMALFSNGYGVSVKLANSGKKKNEEEEENNKEAAGEAAGGDGNGDADSVAEQVGALAV